MRLIMFKKIIVEALTARYNAQIAEAEGKIKNFKRI